jgi:hypothetical protein
MKRSTAEMMTDQEKLDLAAMDEKYGVGAQSTSPQAMSPADPRIALVSPPTAIDRYEPARSTMPFSLTGLTPTLFNTICASAERIFRYLSQVGSTVNSSENHENHLPPPLRIHPFPLNSTQEPKTQNKLNLMAQIPDMLHAQKEYCFEAME